MAYDPLEASYLATVPQAAPIATPLQLQQQKQLAAQTAIQRQIQQENDLKIQAQQEDRQDDETFQKILTKNMLAKQGAAPAPAPAPAASTEASSDDPGAPGAVVAPVAATPATTPSNFQSTWDQSLEEARPLIHDRNALKLAQEQDDHRKAALSLTQDERAQHELTNTQIANALFGVYKTTDPVQKQALYEMAKRIAGKDNTGLNADALPDNVPDDETLMGLITAVGHGLEVGKYADTVAQEKQRLATEAKTRAQEAAIQLKSDTQAAVAKLANAATGEDYMAIKSDPKQVRSDIAATLPDAVPGPLADDFKASLLESAVSPEERITNNLAAIKQAAADKKAASAETLVKFSPEIQAALVATGAVDPKKPTKAEMQAAVKYDTQQKIAARPVTNIVTPENRDAMAQAIASYQMAPPSGFSLTRPEGQSLMADVIKVNPKYQQSQYPIFQDTEKAFTSGQPATKANALNTMMGHLSVLDQAADALKNGDIQVMNRLANFVGAQTGQTPITTYNAIVHRLAPEVTSAYVTSGGTAGERGTNESDFDPKLGPAQIKANIGVSAQLADSKIKALQDQYQRGTYGRGQQKLISDEAEATRQRLAGQSPIKSTPKVGEIRQGYKFKGGDPADQKNWEKQ